MFLQISIIIMSKVKSSEKVRYELLYIIPNKFTEDEAKAIDEKIKGQIVSSSGEVVYSEDWGKKKLAYQIESYNYGYYKLAEFDLEGKNLRELDNFLRLSNDVLRHQIIRVPSRTPEQRQADKKKSDELAAIKKKLREGGAEKTEKIEKPEEKTTSLAAAEKTHPTEERKTFKKKADLKDLDQKLDDILDTKDLI